MKVGDAVKITKPKLYEESLVGLIGILVEQYRPHSPGGKSICRIFWSDGVIDETWRLCHTLEVVSESR